MKHITLLGALLTLALLLAACGPALSQAQTAIPTIVATFETTATAPSVTESPVATGSPEATAMPATTNTQPAGTSTTSSEPASTTTTSTQTTSTTATAVIPVTGGETTIKGTRAEGIGPILADADGAPLYIFLDDTQNGGSSACTDTDCTAEWIPLLINGDPVAGAGAIQKLLGTIQRDDGTTQVTYNGWPLYRYVKDKSSDSTTGQGTDNKWFLISPSGNAIQQTPAQ